MKGQSSQGCYDPFCTLYLRDEWVSANNQCWTAPSSLHMGAIQQNLHPANNALEQPTTFAQETEEYQVQAPSLLQSTEWWPVTSEEAELQVRAIPVFGAASGFV